MKNRITTTILWIAVAVSGTIFAMAQPNLEDLFVGQWYLYLFPFTVVFMAGFFMHKVICWFYRNDNSSTDGDDDSSDT